MFQYAFHTLKKQPQRLLFTVGGIALCIVLMLFLLAIYRGVKDGSVEFIRENRADFWILQRNAWNILRGSSLLSTGHGMLIEDLDGVDSAAPILLLLSGIEKEGEMATVFLTGFQPERGAGGPPHILEGRNVESDDEIVLDKAFAQKYDYQLRDPVHIQDDTLSVVGISSGTNALVIQYAFVTLKRAQALIRFPNIVTCFVVQVADGYSPEQSAAEIREEMAGMVEVYDHQTFLDNNIREMEAGFLPFISTIAIIGIIVLTAILSLLLSINILEQRQDFAVLKAIGSPFRFLRQLIVSQALMLAAISTLAALLSFFPMIALIETMVPEVSVISTPSQIIAVILAVAILSLLSAGISMRRIRHIYPLEAFA